MKRSEKQAIIDNLIQEINSYSHFYLTDISDLNAVKTSQLRHNCFQKEVKLIVVKNTLLKRALDASGKEADELLDALKGNTAMMFCNTGNVPAKLIKDFRKKNPKLERPVLKAAYVEESVYMGEETLETLVTIKSKEELIGDVVALLQSPAKNVVSALQSSGQTLTGILQTLSEKE
ncbi:MAG: 50S ribosomal protein L10 [Prolixibacteraceae bacterium]|nr:50S ribosomal protein L10 [Prolixibacteraceae bacterium]